MATVTRSTVWVSQQTLTAADLNAEFNNLLNALSLVNADVASNAAIASTKLSFGGTNGQYLVSNGSGGLTYSSTIPFSAITGLVINRSFGFFIPDAASVATDLSWNPVSPENMTAIKLWAYARTAPTGADLVARVYNVTKGLVVATVTITANTTSGNNTSMTTAAIAAGDVLRADVTQAGSTVAGSNVSLVLECTQP